MTDTPRRTVLKGVGAGLALAVGGSGVGAADDDTDDQCDGEPARVRVGHLSPDAPNVDVYVDGTKAVSDLAYSDFAPEALSGAYLDLPAGEYDITTKVAGSETTVEPLSVTGFPVEANMDYTVLATGELNPEEESEAGLGLLPLVDNGDEETMLPPVDATLVRLVHASPDAGEVDLDVVEDGEVLTTISGVGFGQDTGYLELPPGDYTVDVGPGALEVPVNLFAGTKISAYVVGNATTEDEDDAGLGAVLSLEATSLIGRRARRSADGKDDGNDDGKDGEHGGHHHG